MFIRLKVVFPWPKALIARFKYPKIKENIYYFFLLPTNLKGDVHDNNE